MLDRLREIVARPLIEGLRDAWAGEFASQNEVLEGVTNALEQATAINDAARNLMSVMAQRTVGMHPLFTITDAAAPGEVALLREAVLRLQASLEGGEMPACVTLGVTKH